VLNKGTLVLEGVTLAQVVKLVVKVFVDLSAGAVLDQKTAEDTELAHPLHLAICYVSRDLTTQTLLFNIFYHILLSSFCIHSSCQVYHFHRIQLQEKLLFTYLGILALAVPFLLPKPLCLPSLLAAFNSRALVRECMVTGLRMMRPSETSLRMV
jgi:hypothetical protein